MNWGVLLMDVIVFSGFGAFCAWMYDRSASTPYYGSAGNESGSQIREDRRVNRNTLIVFLLATLVPAVLGYLADPHGLDVPEGDEYQQDSFGRY